MAWQPLDWIAHEVGHNRAMPACLYLLDEPHGQVDGRRFELNPAKPSFLLIYLAVRGEWVSRDALGALLWPDNSDDEARHNVRVNLHRAKNLPWVEGLEVERERIRWLIGTDVAEFREALGQADWKEAVRVHRRPFLESFLLQDTPALEEWASLERESLLEAWRNAALRHSEQLQQDGQHAEAATVLAELLRQDLLAEDILQSYLRVAYLSGQREAALKLYERFAQELERELGLGPMQDTIELAQTLRRSQPLKALAEKPQAKIPLEVLKPPRLIGREAEQARLESASVGLVSGEPGVGKTRLLQEVFPDAPIIRCREGLENLPFYPVLEYLKAHLDAQKSEVASDAQKSEVASLPSGKASNALPDLGPYREDLARLLPEVWPGFAPPPAEPLSAKARLLEALARALANSGCLLFDDLQWADEGTLELFLYLANQDKRLMATYRTHEVGASLGKTLEALRSKGIEEIALQPLGSDSVQTLLADLIGTSEGPQRFSGWLHDKTGGNPFFALETLKALFENGVLRAEGGEWHTDLDEITQDYSELQIPPKVAEVVRRRVGRLSEPALRVVQAASVVGEGFTPKLLQGVIGLSEWAVLDGLEEVVGSGMIAGSRFAHDLIRQGVYGGLQEQRRMVLHAKVAEELQRKAEPAVVAEHWFAANHKAQAVAQWREAAERSVDAPTAVRLLERAIQTNEDGQLAAELELKLAEMLGGSGRYDEGHSRVLALLQRPLPANLRAWALILKAGYFVQTMNTAQADPIMADLERGYSPESLEERERILLLLLKKSWHFQRGEFAKALEVARQLTEEYARSDDPHTRFDLALLKNDMGAQLTQLGRFEEAQLEIEQAFDLAQQVRSRHARISCMSNLVYHWIARKDPGRVLEIARSVLAEDPDYIEGRTDNLEVNLGTACLKLERWSEALHHYEQVRGKARHPMFALLSRVRLIALYHQAGRLEETHQAIEQALVHAAKVAHLPTRALLLTNVLKHGTGDQIKRVRDLVEPLDPSKLPAEIRGELEAAQR